VTNSSSLLVVALSMGANGRLTERRQIGREGSPLPAHFRWVPDRWGLQWPV